MTMQIAIITFLVSFATITGWLLCREPAQITQFKTPETPSTPDKPPPSQPAVIDEPYQERIEQNQIIAVSEAEIYVKKKLQTIIPLVDFHEIPFEGAIDFLRLKIKEQEYATASPLKSIRFRLSNINRHHRDDRLENPNHPNAPRLVTLKTENISIAEILNQICAQSNLHWQITNYGILIKPIDPPR